MTARSAGDVRALMQAVGFTGVGETEALAEGWQVADFTGVGRRGLAALVRKTGAPAVMVSFLDSDVGFVEAATPDGRSWEALLNRDMAESYEIPVEQFPVEPAVDGALAWAAAAGLTPEEESVRRTLTGAAVFVEELSADLLVALGLLGARRS
ncbi:hypothetical protein [Streptomyces sp. GC420]|uniref:hypothetical protein n=1 Tax=Streptomyces sp. GC420 TaxID=2697568 RepID=UPI001AA0D6E7|nr:hypothetical protein [Streptomyces sp. GC420]